MRITPSVNTAGLSHGWKFSFHLLHIFIFNFHSTWWCFKHFKAWYTWLLFVQYICAYKACLDLQRCLHIQQIFHKIHYIHTNSIRCSLIKCTQLKCYSIGMYFYLWDGKDSIISEQQWYSQYTYSHFRGLRCAVTFTDCYLSRGIWRYDSVGFWVNCRCFVLIHYSESYWSSYSRSWTVSASSWKFGLSSAFWKEQQRKPLGLGPILNVNSTESCNKIWKFTYIKPAAWHNAVNSFVGQLGAKETQAPGHLVHYFRVVEALIRKPSQSVHLPH